MKKWHFLAVAAPALVCATSPVLAQTADPARVEAAPQTSTVEDIVVTAQRREERLQDVPISVSAATGEALTKRGIDSTSSLQALAPGLDVSQAGNGSTPFLRGIGSSSGAIGSEASVATYVDGVYIGAPVASIFSLSGISRIEVLRGPQGTLFGRNATGGVISVVTRDPTYDPKVEASVGYANYDTISASLYASTRLSDRLAVNIAAFGRDQRDGWGRNVTTDKEAYLSDETSFRAKLLWDASDTTHLILAADHTRARSEGGLTQTAVPGSIQIDGQGYVGRYSPRGGSESYSLVEQSGVSLKASHDFDWASLVSITAYREFDGEVVFDQDGTPIPAVSANITQEGDSFSQELQLLSAPDSAVNWIVGGYYFKDNQAYAPLALANIYSIDSSQETTSLAAFGQATYEFLPATNVTAGIRYTEDERSAKGRRLTPAGVVIPGSPAQQEVTYSKVTYRLSVDHRFSESVNAYASYNRGFKSGVYNLLTYQAPPVLPEVLDALEIGVKTDLFDRRLRFNVSAFNYDYTDIQVEQIVAGATQTVNAGQAKVYGGEIEFTLIPVENFTLSGGLSLLHGRYTSFANGPVNVPNPGSCDVDPATPGNQPGTTGAPVGGNLTCSADLSGNRMIRTPDMTFTISGDWRIPVSVGDFDLNLSLYHNSGFAWHADNRLKQDSYELLNASVQWTAPSERYFVRAWGKNLLDTEYSISTTTSGLGDSQSPAPPLSFGVTLGYVY